MTPTTLSNSDKLFVANKIAMKHVDQIFRKLEIKLPANGELRAPCPCHQGDNKTGFTWSTNKGIWACWTQGCHNTYGNHLIGLICGVLDISQQQAISLVEEISSQKVSDADIDQLEIEKFISNRPAKKSAERKIYPNPPLTQTPLYFLSRGFSIDVLSEFKCFACKNKAHPLYGRDCVSITDHLGNIVGFSGRLTKNQHIYDRFNPKWMHYPKGLNKHDILFGMFQAAECVRQKRSVIIVEGPLDVMRMHDLGICNSVALLGTNIFFDQIKLLLNLDVLNVVLLLDPDSAGNKAVKKISKELKNYFHVHDSSQYLTEDPGEMTIDAFKTRLQPVLEEIESYVQRIYS